MSELDPIIWQLGGLALGVAIVLILNAWERAAWRRLMLYVHLQHPMASLTPPPTCDLADPAWIEEDSAP